MAMMSPRGSTDFKMKNLTPWKSAPLHEEEKERHQDSKSHSHREDPKARLEVNTFGQNILRKIDNEKNIINKNGRPELLILKSLTPDPIKTKKKKIFEPNVC
jgi:hypothetical protein